MQDPNKEVIIAERIRLKYGGNIAVIILLLFLLGGTGFLIWWAAENGAKILCAVLLVFFFVLLIWVGYDTRKIKKHNNLPQVILTLRSDTFTVYAAETTIQFTKYDIVDMTYKNKKAFIYTPYYMASAVYNYGTVTLFIRDETLPHGYYKLKLKNVANPELVFNKLYSFLEWDVLDDDDERVNSKN